MGDRELLELAAKAAGIALYWAEDDPECDWVQGTYPRIPDHEVLEKWTWKIWNPLTDDGDALRLAVKLKMRVHITESYVAVDIYSDGAWACEIKVGCMDSGWNDDPFAAARRAIVMAAAEIGKGMKDAA